MLEVYHPEILGAAVVIPASFKVVMPPGSSEGGQGMIFCDDFLDTLFVFLGILSALGLIFMMLTGLMSPGDIWRMWEAQMEFCLSCM